MYFSWFVCDKCKKAVMRSGYFGNKVSIDLHNGYYDDVKMHVCDECAKEIINYLQPENIEEAINLLYSKK